jgi:hypothetical protein
MGMRSTRRGAICGGEGIYHWIGQTGADLDTYEQR